MDKCQQLFERMDASFRGHRAVWMELAPDVLIKSAKDIAAIQDTREYLAQGRGIDPDGVDYLLTLADPLQAVADHWLKRMDDLSDFAFALDDLCQCRTVLPRKSVLAQLHKHTAAEPPKPSAPAREQEVR